MKTLPICRVDRQMNKLKYKQTNGQTDKLTNRMLETRYQRKFQILTRLPLVAHLHTLPVRITSTLVRDPSPDLILILKIPTIRS